MYTCTWRDGPSHCSVSEYKATSSSVSFALYLGLDTVVLFLACIHAVECVAIVESFLMVLLVLFLWSIGVVCACLWLCVCVSVHVYKCVIRYRVLTTMCHMYLQGCRIREIGGGQAAGERGELITRHVHTCSVRRWSDWYMQCLNFTKEQTYMYSSGPSRLLFAPALCVHVCVWYVCCVYVCVSMYMCVWASNNWPSVATCSQLHVHLSIVLFTRLNPLV